MSITKRIVTRKTRGGYTLAISVYEQDRWILTDLKKVLDLFFQQEDEILINQKKEKKNDTTTTTHHGRYNMKTVGPNQHGPSPPLRPRPDFCLYTLEGQKRQLCTPTTDRTIINILINTWYRFIIVQVFNTIFIVLEGIGVQKPWFSHVAGVQRFFNRRTTGGLSIPI